jgi:hypothetical protein
MSHNRAGTGSMAGSIGGTAVVCCIHQKPKRANTSAESGGLEFNPKIEYAQLCPCCENLFAHPTDLPHFCPDCSPNGIPRPVPGGEDLPRGKNA